MLIPVGTGILFECSFRNGSDYKVTFKTSSDRAQLREHGEGFSEVILEAEQSLAGQDGSFRESVMPSGQLLPSFCCLKPSLIPHMRSACTLLTVGNHLF